MARKLTYEPNLMNAADIERLRKHYKESQVLEIVFTIAGNNATNRWKEALGIPQEKEHGRFFAQPTGKEEKSKSQPGKAEQRQPKDFLTPTSEKYKARPSVVAPLLRTQSGEIRPMCVSADRPVLESRAEVEAHLAACRKRSALVTLVEDAQARVVLPDWGKEPVPQWVRLLANFPKEGKGRILSVQRLQEHGNIAPVLRAEIDWIAARHDRAWYALGNAKERLQALGVSEADIYALDGSWSRYSPAERAAFSLIRKMTVAPFQLVDEDMAELRKHFTDAQCVELVLRGSTAAFFNRATEPFQLPLL